MIPQYAPLWSPASNSMVQLALEDNCLGPGEYCTLFENALKLMYGFKHVILTNSGTSALMVAMKAAIGDKVGRILAPSYTFLAGHNAARFLGYDVDLVDINEDLVMDLNLLQRKLGRKAYDAVLFVNHNAYNDSGYIGDIAALCREHSVSLIEDSSQCIHVEYSNRRDGFCGTIGDMGILSFSVPKLLTTGQGGAIITSDNVLADKCRRIVDHGGGNWRKNRIHEEIGINLRMSDLNAAYGFGQLKDIQQKYNLRTALHKRYKDLLGDNYISQSHSWMCVARYPDASKVVDELGKFSNGEIIAKQYYQPIHWNIPYEDCGDHFPAAEAAFRELVYLPSSLSLTQEMIFKISHIITRTIND